MEHLIKEFYCEIKTNESRTYYTYKAIFNPLYEKQAYRLKVHTTRIDDEVRKLDQETTIYYDTLKETLNNYEYYYNLCKNNMFTTYIKITKE